MWQIFIRTSWRSHKHCKCSFSLTSGPRYVGNVRSCLLLVVRHDRFNLLSADSIKHSLDIMLKYIESDSTQSGRQLNKRKLDYIQYWLAKSKMWQIFIRTSWRSHKHCKCSFSLTSGPRNVENVRSSLRLVVRHVAHDRFNLLSVASIKHSLDMMLMYIESDSTLSDMQVNKRKLDYIQYWKAQSKMWQIFIRTSWRSQKHCNCSFSLNSGPRNVENVRCSLRLVVRHVAHDRFNLLSVASIKHSLDIMLMYIESDSTLSDMQVNKRNLDYIHYWKAQIKMWQIFIRTSWRSQKHCKCSSSLTSGPWNVENVRSSLRLVVSHVAHDRFNLLSVASIKHSLDRMLMYIESDSTLSDMQVNKRNLDYIHYWKAQIKMWQIFIRTSWRSHKHCKCSFSLTSGPRNVGNVRSCLLLVVKHDRFKLLSVASIKHSVDIMLMYIESDSTLSDMQVNKRNLDYIHYWKAQIKMWQIFIRTSWRSHKHCKCSFSLTSGPRNVGKVRSCLLLVVRHDRFNLLSVASIKHSVDIMLKYIESDTTQSDMQINKRKLDYIQDWKAQSKMWQIFIRTSWRSHKHCKCSFSLTSGPRNVEVVGSTLRLVVRHVAHDRFNLLSVASIKHSLDIMLMYIESDSTLPDMQVNKRNLDYIHYWKAQIKMWQIFIRTSWRSHKHCKCSFSLTSGPRNVENVRSCLLLVVRHDRFNLLSVDSIKHSVDIMLKYIESDTTQSDMHSLW